MTEIKKIRWWYPTWDQEMEKGSEFYNYCKYRSEMKQNTVYVKCSYQNGECMGTENRKTDQAEETTKTENNKKCM